MTSQVISSFDVGRDKASTVTMFIGGHRHTDLVIDCICGHRVSETNILPTNNCPKCGSSFINAKPRI